jgi:hypothetical protein
VASLTFQFSVVQELLIGHCRERRGWGTGSEPGREGGWGEARAWWGWAGQPGSLCPLLNLNLAFPRQTARTCEDLRGRPFFLLL